jgi:hypothetical protein
MASVGSTVVQQSTHDPKFEGSNPTAGACNTKLFTVVIVAVS